nr:hypothetical protein [uncultured Desulfobacter sp.]
MPLVNFGSILTFAEEIESRQLDFCNTIMALPHCEDLKHWLQTLGKSAQKRLAEVRRVRRENVTEMILETIQGFSRDPFALDLPDLSTLHGQDIAPLVIQMGNRAAAFYEVAADKLKGQAEVSRALKGLKKKHLKELQTIEGTKS